MVDGAATHSKAKQLLPRNQAMLALSQLGNGSVAPADLGCLTTTNPAFAPYGVVNRSLAGHTAKLGDRPRA